MKKIFLSLGVCTGLLVLAACASTGARQAGGDLTGQVWALSEIMGKGLAPGTGISAQFTTDGKVGGSAGCNQYAGTYTTSGNSLTISTPLASTRMACDPAVMAQESAYLEALGEVRTYSIKGDQLALNDAQNATLLTYKSQSQELAGTDWVAVGYNNGNQAVTSVLAGTSLTASFGKDGTLSGTGGCNTYTGSYTVDGNQIKIGPLASTMKACSDPPGVMDQEAQYLAALQSAATYQIEGNALELRTADGALAADFTKQ